MHLRYFRMSEFKCNCGCGRNDMNPDFLVWLDDVRRRAGVPFRITSGFRCFEHNKAVGGKPNSAHLRGNAVDVACRDSKTRYHILRALAEKGCQRYGVADTFVHMDQDTLLPQEVVWVY